MSVCVCVCVCVCGRARARVCVCVCVAVCESLTTLPETTDLKRRQTQQSGEPQLVFLNDCKERELIIMKRNIKMLSNIYIFLHFRPTALYSRQNRTRCGHITQPWAVSVVCWLYLLLMHLFSITILYLPHSPCSKR